MSQVPLLVAALKSALKNAGKTYADAALHLGLSEASVKRLFSTNRFTLQRLESICRFVNLDLTDLVKQADEARNRLSHLSETQETKLVSNARLMLIAVCVRNNWRFEDILKHYALSETECILHLTTLDQLKLIELLPGNRFKLLIRADFRWLPNGPIERFYRKNIEHDFFASRFSSGDQQRLFLTGALSRGSVEQLQIKLNKLAHDFSAQHNDDMCLPIEDKHNVGLVLAFRSWELMAFSALKRKV